LDICNNIAEQCNLNISKIGKDEYILMNCGKILNRKEIKNNNNDFGQHSKSFGGYHLTLLYNKVTKINIYYHY
jgi:hypothetical protein